MCVRTVRVVVMGDSEKLVVVTGALRVMVKNGRVDPFPNLSCL